MPTVQNILKNISSLEFVIVMSEGVWGRCEARRTARGA